MSLRSIEAWWPEQPAQQLRRGMLRRQRGLKRSFRRGRRQLINLIKRQYYLTNALADSRLALQQNEDIALGCLIIIVVLTFSTTSMLGNVIYDFMLAASALSNVLRTNLLLLILLASCAISVSGFWLIAFLQNALSIALMEGANRKQKRSLRTTLRRSLRLSPATAIAWGGLLLAASAPAGLLMLISGLIMFAFHLKLATALIYMVALGLIGLGWLLGVLANYTLVPYVVLFEKPASWQAAIGRSHQLVQHKGRLFIVGSYIALAVSMTGLYYLAQLIQAISPLNGLIPSLFLSIMAVSLDNACLTMLYRKRRLARR